MPDVWLDVDTAVEVQVNILQLTDDTDFKTLEEAVAYNAAGMDLNWNFTTSAGVPSQTNVVPTTAGDYDWAHMGNAIYKIEIPASGGVSINNDTEGYGYFSGKCDGVLSWRGPTYGFRAAALNDALCDGGDVLDVNLTEIVGTAQRAADLAEIAQYLFANGVTLTAIIANNSVMARILATTGNVVNYSETTDSLQSIRDVAPHGTAMRGTDNAALATDVSTIGTNVGLILADTGTDGVVVAAASKTGYALSAAGRGAIWDVVLTAGTHDVGYSAGQRLRYLILDGATAQAGAAQTITLAAASSATDDIYSQNIISIVGGTGAGQTRMIVEYDGTTKIATVDRPWTTQPAAGSVYELLPSVGEVLATHGIAQAATASTITLATNALAIADSYVGSDIYITGGTGIGQTRLITAYTTGRVATISPDWDTTPDATSIYKVLPIGRSITDSMSTASVTAIRTEMEASGSLLDWLRNVAEGDAIIGGTSPFTLTIYPKDTTTGALITKLLYQKDGTAVSDTDHVVGKQLESAP
jgi:hypothetical protein